MRLVAAAIAAALVAGGVGVTALPDGDEPAAVTAAAGSTRASERGLPSRELPVSRSSARRSLTQFAAREAADRAADRAAARAAREAKQRAERKAAAAKAARVAARIAAEAARAARRAAAAEAAEAAARAVVPGPVVGSRFLTAPLNLWTGPGETYTLLKVLPEGSRVGVTGRVRGGWAEVVRGSHSRWVNAAYLVRSLPKPAPAPGTSDAPGISSGSSSSSSGISSAPCPSGSEVENGLTPDAIAVHRAVCHQFPSITVYGGLRSDGEHGQGRALDIMVSDPGLGTAIAEWLRANRSALGVSELLWAQRIWTVQRSSEGWRTFPDRGSATGNHYDHVHVTVYGSAG